jgi:beta-mannosidase
LLADAVHFPRGRQAALHSVSLQTDLAFNDGYWTLHVTSDRFAQSVHIDAEGFRPADDGFHLSPGQGRQIELIPLGLQMTETPHGEIRTLGNAQLFRF